VLLADGTFSCRPLIYERGQLYSLHGRVGDTYPSLAFALLPDKTTDTYDRLLHAIISLEELQDWRPEVVLLDFETAAHKAFQRAFPQARLSGCLFHFKQVGKVSLPFFSLPL